jgi:hypothetical protein
MIQSLGKTILVALSRHVSILVLTVVMTLTVFMTQLMEGDSSASCRLSTGVGITVSNGGL